jgi:hypothetical protein
MTKEEYLEWLSHTRWKEKRLIILERDKHSCKKCKSKKNLHVHHTYYISDAKPWEVPDDCLITLCEVCHRREHAIKVIGSRNPSKKRNVSKKVGAKSDLYNLSDRDKNLQKKYDELKSKGILPKDTVFIKDDHDIKIKLRNEQSNKLLKAKIRKRRRKS